KRGRDVRSERRLEVSLNAIPIEVDAVVRFVLPDLPARGTEYVEVGSEDREPRDVLPGVGRVVGRDVGDLVALLAPEVALAVEAVDRLAERRHEPRDADAARALREHGARLRGIPEHAPEAAGAGIRDVEAVHVADDRGRSGAGKEPRQVDDDAGDLVVDLRQLPAEGRD